MSRCADHKGISFAEIEYTEISSMGSYDKSTLIQSAQYMLRQLVFSFNNRRHYSCPFVRELRASLKPFQMLIVNRLLATVAALRIEFQHQKADRFGESEMVVQLGDYAVTRNLLLCLPIPVNTPVYVYHSKGNCNKGEPESTNISYR